MKTWLETVRAELKKVPDDVSIEPESTGCQHDREVGVAPLELKKLYYLWLDYQKRSQEAAAAVLTLSGDARRAKLAEASYLDSGADALKEVFWVSCRAAFPELKDKQQIGVRKGWKVVWTDHPPMPHVGILGGSISDLLQAIGASASSPEAAERGDHREGRSKVH